MPILIVAMAFGIRPAAGQSPNGPDQAPPRQRPDYSYFEKLNNRLEEQKKKDEETREKDRAAENKIEAQAKAAGGVEQARREHGASIGQINARLRPAPGQPQPAKSSSGPRLEPGTHVEIVTKDGRDYSGTLVGIDGTRVRLQTIPDPSARPSEFDLNNIAAFRTRDGMFAYNLRSGRFEPALAIYRLNRTTGDFERMDAKYGSAFLTEPARIIGPPPGTVWGLVGLAPDGS
ncbi:MAG TPA: hypothetical protein VH120_12130, partial [Gemmataceae bacterium]|nr:hypothetical protein [Gemmataceae bacterium]